MNHLAAVPRYAHLAVTPHDDHLWALLRYDHWAAMTRDHHLAALPRYGGIVHDDVQASSLTP